MARVNACAGYLPGATTSCQMAWGANHAPTERDQTSYVLDVVVCHGRARQ